MIRTKGIVVPVEWDEDGIAVAFAVSTYDEDEYVLDGPIAREQMMGFVRKEVEVCGTVRIDKGRKVLTVAEINPKRKAVA